ncbi:MAG: hypothetical protein Q7T79_03660 [bacterium]|nr:hypothetical protein [bacterium]
MFDEINDQNVNQANVPTPGIGSMPNFNQSVPKSAEDILAGVDQSEKPAVFQPKAPTPSVGYVPENEESKTTDSKKFFVLGVIIIVIILIIGVGYLGIKFYLNSKISDKALNNSSKVVEPVVSPIPENSDIIKNPIVEVETSTATSTGINGNSIITATTTIIATNTDMIIESTTIVDSDQDGLIDEEERLLGTDPNSSDSDNDGLSDREEVKTYSTNPLNADTDSDGYQDGAEVKNGYNPKGSGKLEVKSL